jgi:hypothetical protein
LSVVEKYCTLAGHVLLNAVGMHGVHKVQILCPLICICSLLFFPDDMHLFFSCPLARYAMDSGERCYWFKKSFRPFSSS